MAPAAVIITVLNEQDTILGLLRSLEHQTQKPAEVIVVDGGSTDRTPALLQSYRRRWAKLKVFRSPGNRSTGRNFGVSRSSQPLIAFTDAGCIPDTDWLEQLIRPFLDSPSTQVVSGYYRGVSATPFESSLIPYCLVMPDRAGKSEFLPSTRSMAIRRKVFDQVGGFNPQIDPGEDYDLSLRLKQAGVNFVFVPQAVVAWRPRRSLSQAAWMFMRFAYADAFARHFRPKVRLLAGRYLGFVYLVFLSRSWPALYPLLAAGAFFYLTWSIAKNFRYVRHPAGLFWLPVLQITSDIAVLFGTLMGILDLISFPSKKA